MIRRLLPIAAILVFAITAPAYAAHSFVLTRAGEKPNVAVDRGGTGHFVWDQRAADGGSVTHYAACCGPAADVQPERAHLPPHAGDRSGQQHRLRRPRSCWPPTAASSSSPIAAVRSTGPTSTRRCCSAISRRRRAELRRRRDHRDHRHGRRRVRARRRRDHHRHRPELHGRTGGATGLVQRGRGPARPRRDRGRQDDRRDGRADRRSHRQRQDVHGWRRQRRPERDRELGLRADRSRRRPRARRGAEGDLPARPQRTALRPAAHRHRQGPPGQDARPDRTLVPDLRHRERRRRRARPRRLGAGPRPALPAHEQERNAPGGLHRLVTGSSFFNLSVGAGANGRGWVAWDSNGPNKTVRAIVTP